MKKLTYPPRVQEGLASFLHLDGRANEFLAAITAYRDELLTATMGSGVSDARAAELRYSARGVTDIIDSLRDL